MVARAASDRPQAGICEKPTLQLRISRSDVFPDCGFPLPDEQVCNLTISTLTVARLSSRFLIAKTCASSKFRPLSIKGAARIALVSLPERLKPTAGPVLVAVRKLWAWLGPADVTGLQQRAADTLSKALQQTVLPAKVGSSQWRVYATSRVFRRRCKQLRTAVRSQGCSTSPWPPLMMRSSRWSNAPVQPRASIGRGRLSSGTP